MKPLPDNTPFLQYLNLNNMANEVKGCLIPLKTGEGVWMQPERARLYFKNGKGITLKRLMDLIYSGKLNGRVKRDFTGWYVLIPFHAIEHQPLQAA